MPEEPIVTLVFDPYGLHAGGGQRVGGPADELAAFHTIAELLRHDRDPSTRRPQTYVLNRASWEHFRSLRGVRGVRVQELTPRTQVRALWNAEPPSWLTDETVVRWNLLNLTPPSALRQSNWIETIASWLMPGIGEASSLGMWLEAAAAAAPIPQPVDVPEVLDWLTERLRLLANKSVPADVLTDLVDEFRASAAPVEFARAWLRRRALLPLWEPIAGRPIGGPDLRHESAANIARAKYVPLVFPLPVPLHDEVSRIVSRALRSAQIESPGAFAGVVAVLNAIWEGVAEELDRWLQVQPRGMSTKAAQHLSSLPGFERSELAHRLVRLYAPPEHVDRWTGVDASFDAWVNSYAAYIESSFYQRTLPEGDDDPAQPFSRWVKANPAVFFNHPERGYFCVAQTIQQALQRGQAVITVIVDALAVHAAAPVMQALELRLNERPTRVRYCLTPVPTITAVCKESILAGVLPKDCRGGSNLESSLLRRYALTPEQLLLAAQWQDAERVRITKAVRLLVYRDNRLDEQLGKLASYRALREALEPIALSMAELVAQWAQDFQHWNRALPLVLITADHGFTYGPPPGQETSARALDGSHRCVDIGLGRPEDLELRDESVTFLDRETFNLRSGYLAARGRTFGRGTISGWALSHGGLLPEEVIIPVLEWFGDRHELPFPDVVVKEGAVREQGVWVVALELQNDNLAPAAAGRLLATIPGETAAAPVAYPQLRRGDVYPVRLKVPGPEGVGGEPLGLEVTLTARGADASPALPAERRVVRRIDVNKVVQLVERTPDQAAFEEMF